MRLRHITHHSRRVLIRAQPHEPDDLKRMRRDSKMACFLRCMIEYLRRVRREDVVEAERELAEVALTALARRDEHLVSGPLARRARARAPARLGLGRALRPEAARDADRRHGERGRRGRRSAVGGGGRRTARRRRAAPHKPLIRRGGGGCRDGKSTDDGGCGERRDRRSGGCREDAPTTGSAAARRATPNDD